MPNLSSEIKKLLPLDSELKLNTLVNIMKERGTHIDSYIDAKIIPLLKTTRLTESYYWRTGRNPSDVDMEAIQRIIKNNEAEARRNMLLKEARKASGLSKKEWRKRESTIHRGGLSEDDPLRYSYEKQQLYEQRRTTSQYDRFEYGISDW